MSSPMKAGTDMPFERRAEPGKRKALILAILVHLLLAKFGRNIGLGTKWTPDKGEYAMIVGASGAVGSEYAREFASMGFNLLLISRNAAKLEKLAAEFKEKYKIKDVSVVVIPAEL